MHNITTTDYTSCRICGTNEFLKICNIESYIYVKCVSCDVIRQYPYPEEKEIEDFYSQYLDIKQKENPLYLSPEYWDSYKKIKDLTFNDLNFHRESIKGKKILDIGCGTGKFLKYVEEYEAKASGIDISPRLIEITKKSGFNCTIKTIYEVEETYDIISMWHVIEHIDNPKNYLERVYQLLHNGGSFLLETPCTGVVSESFGEKWRFFMPIEHLHLFSQKGIFNLLSKYRFKLVNWVRFGSGIDSGTTQDFYKKSMDRIAKKLGIGDTIALWCKK